MLRAGLGRRTFGHRTISAGPSFSLPFADLGSGAVRTTEIIGAAAPTFTRATTATTIGSTGLVVSVASGTARSYYDPTSLAYLGYLAEGARTNLCLQSEAMGVTWGVTRATISSNSIASPDGTVTADTLVEDGTAANTHFVAQAITVVNATAYAWSLWAKAGPGSKRWLVLNTDLTNAAFEQSFFDLSNGTITSQAAGLTSASITSYPNGWYRIVVVGTARASAAINFQYLLANTSSSFTYNGDSTSGNYIWGNQVEAGSFASSYMPTTVASFTRNADSLSYPSTILNASAGTMFAQFTPLQVAAAAAEIVRHIPTSGNFILREAATAFNGFYGDQNGSQAAIFTAGTSAKVALAYQGTAATQAANGAVSALAVAVAPVFNAAANLYIGESGAAALQLFGCVSSIRYFPRRLLDQQLQILTA